MDFKAKNILITGGVSGIGKIMARKALERGVAHLVIWDINEQGLEDVKSEFNTFGIPVSTYAVNLAESEQIRISAQKVRSEVGDIDIVINNAGIVVGKYFHEHTHQDISRSLLINSSAVMHTTLEFLPAMMRKNSGAVCTVASSAGLISNPKMSVYAASKWAAVGWSDSLRLEMKKLQKKIAFTTIMPFYINTGMFDGVKSKILPIMEPEEVSERIISAIESGKKMVAMPMPYWFIRLSQGILPIPVFDWVMENVFGIYDTMNDFKGRN